MATLKILGQSAPAATTETTMYTVPGATSTTCSTLVICNRGGTAASFRITVVLGAGASGNANHLYYDCPIDPNQSIALTLGLTLQATATVRVYASNTNLSFSLFGVENP